MIYMILKWAGLYLLAGTATTVVWIARDTYCQVKSKEDDLIGTVVITAIWPLVWVVASLHAIQWVGEAIGKDLLQIKQNREERNQDDQFIK